MKVLIIILIVASFLQTTIWPLDLALIILISRAYLKAQKSNLFLAFFLGLLISHLTLGPIGVKSMVYLTVVQITQVLSKSRLAGHPFLIVPLSFVFSLLDGNFYLAVVAAIFSLPIFYSLRLWQERFAPAKEIKLRI